MKIHNIAPRKLGNFFKFSVGPDDTETRSCTHTTDMLHWFWREMLWMVACEM